MVSSDIVEYFDAVVLSDDIGVNKPDKRIFDHALKKSNALADRTFIIGDNPDTDIAGAVNAGWRAIYFNRNGEGVSISMDNAIEIFKLSEIQHIL
jgi:putative hydrolase of the HAD superfamily